jgi:hypothetical protein
LLWKGGGLEKKHGKEGRWPVLNINANCTQPILFKIFYCPIKINSFITLTLDTNAIPFQEYCFQIKVMWRLFKWENILLVACQKWF